MRLGALGFVCSMLWMLGCGGGSSDADLTVRVLGDFVAVHEAATAEIALYEGSSLDTLSAAISKSHTFTMDEVMARGVVVAAYADISTGPRVIRVALKRANGTVLAERPVLLELRKDVTVTVPFTANCAEVQCPSSADSSLAACLDGQCVDPRCTVETPEYCGTAIGCANDDACTDASECASAKCVEGLCVYAPDDDACERDQYCAREDGCVTIAPTPDAGVDASVVDASADASADGALDAQTDSSQQDATIIDSAVADAAVSDGSSSADSHLPDGAVLIVEDASYADATHDANDNETDSSVVVELDMSIPAHDANITADASVETTDASANFDTGPDAPAIDPCAPNPCGSGSCTPSGATYACSCPTGYSAPATGGSCTDVDECLLPVCGAHEDCHNTPGSFECSCSDGFEDIAGVCTDIDECMENPTRCGVHGDCSNASGYYVCNCDTGYASENGSECEDFNECLAGPTTCGVSELCTNTEASYTCTGLTSIAASGSATCAVFGNVAQCRGGGYQAPTLISFGSVTPVSVTLGYGAYALRPDGNVITWSLNGTTTSAMSFGSGRTVLAIASGQSNACFIMDDHTLRCIGANANGQLGYGDSLFRGAPTDTVNLGSSRTAVAVANGSNHTCAILDDGTLKCWGSNSLGQLGYNDTTDRNAPPATTVVNLGAMRTALSVAAGDQHTCAILDTHQVKCWGFNLNGQLGYNSGSIWQWAPPIAAVDLGASRTALAIRAGGSTTCALLDDHSVKCWGDGSYGQIGTGRAEKIYSPPTQPIDLGVGRTASTIEMGSGHVCAMLDDASMKCWGFNALGQIAPLHSPYTLYVGHAFGTPRAAVDLGLGRVALSLSANSNATCAVLDDQSVKCWGENTYGQLGKGDALTRATPSASPINLGTNRTARATSNGVVTSCAILDDRSVACWGTAGFTALGYGDSIDRFAPSGEVLDLGTARTARSISSNGFTNGAVLDDDSLVFWGNNSSVGLVASTPVQVTLPAGRTAQVVAMGWSHACALLDDASVRCWGQNGWGQLGLGDTMDRTTISDAVDLDGASAVDAISGNGYSCARLDDGNARCWGSLSISDVKEALGTAQSIVDLGGGHAHACFILEDHTLRCVGSDDRGQLGIDFGELDDINLGTGRTATQVVGGYAHTCALLDNGSVRCWGNNEFGQLGVTDGLYWSPPATPVNLRGY